MNKQPKSCICDRPKSKVKCYMCSHVMYGKLRFVCPAPGHSKVGFKFVIKNEKTF